MRISIVIPTYNRADTLRMTLEGYAAQSGDHQMLELLVVDDGSKDHTQATVAEFLSKYRWLRYLRQENQGQAAARNHGIREARGDLILFGDDDIIPSPNMVAEHVAWHKRHPEPEVGVLGLVDLDPRIDPTPFMVWSGLYGPQFNFGHLESGKEVGFGHMYFCNTSLKTRFLIENGQFDEMFNKRFNMYGWEDLELGYRLLQKGFRLIYSRDTVGHHYKRETFGDAIRRIERLYSSWPVFGETEAGHYFLEQWKSLQNRSHGGVKGRLKRALRPLKSPLMQLCKPLADSRMPMPNWFYDMLFYHYVTPFSDFVAKADRSTE